MVDSPRRNERNPPKEKQAQAGVGLALHKRTGGLFVTGLIEGSPAHKSEIEILPGDILTHVDGVQVGSDLEKAKSLIKGTTGSKVSLELVRGSRKLQVTLRRGSTVPAGSPVITPLNKAKMGGVSSGEGTPTPKGRNRPMRRSNTDIPGMLKKAAGLGLPEGGVYEESEMVQMAEDTVALLLEQERVSIEYGSEVEMFQFRKPNHPIARWARREMVQLREKVEGVLKRREEGGEVGEGEVKGLMREINDKVSLGVQHLLYCLEAEEMDDETKLHLWVVVEEHIYLEIGEHLAKFFALEAKDQDEKLKSAYENFAHVTPEEMMNGRNSSGNASPASDPPEPTCDVSETRRRFDSAIRVAREVEECGHCPVSRLLVLERCCRKVSAILQRSSRAISSSMDEFLPSLMFVILQARVQGLCGMSQMMTAGMASLSPSDSLSYTLTSLSTLLAKACSADSTRGWAGGWEKLSLSMVQDPYQEAKGSPSGLHARKLFMPTSPNTPSTPSPLSPPSISLNVSSPLRAATSKAQRFMQRESSSGTSRSGTIEASSTRGEGQEWREDVWYAYVDDDSGLEYYYNPTTQETEWETPQNAEVRRGSMQIDRRSMASVHEEQEPAAREEEEEEEQEEHEEARGGHGSIVTVAPTVAAVTNEGGSRILTFEEQQARYPGPVSPLLKSPDLAASPPKMVGRGGGESLVDLTLNSRAAAAGAKEGSHWDGDKAKLQHALGVMIKFTQESSLLARKVREEVKRERRRAEAQEDMIHTLLREKKALRALLKRSDEEVVRKEELLEKATRELKKRTIASLSPSDSMSVSSMRGPLNPSPTNRSRDNVSPSNRSITSMASSVSESPGHARASNFDFRSPPLNDSFAPATDVYRQLERESASTSGSDTYPHSIQPSVVQRPPEPSRSPLEIVRSERRVVDTPPTASPRHSLDQPKPQEPRPTGVGLTFQEDYSYQPSPTKIHGLQATNTHKRPAWRVRSIKTGYEKMIGGKVLVGDILYSIDGESCFGLSRYDLGTKAVGPDGSKCELVIMRPRKGPGSAEEEQQEDKITVSLIRKRPKKENEGAEPSKPSPSPSLSPSPSPSPPNPPRHRYTVTSANVEGTEC